MADISQHLNAIKTAKYGKDVRGSIYDAIEAMNEESSSAKEAAETAKDSAKASAEAAKISASEAKESETNAKTSEANAKTSETNASNSASEALDATNTATVSASKAKESETNAKSSETKAKESETNAKTSEAKAKESETNAKSSETKAKESETNAKSSETKAKESETNAKSSEAKAKESETNAKTSETNAASSASAAANSAASANDAATALVGSISPQAHSRIFRGKNLGSTITDEQKAAIKDGSFKDLFLGDYWKINRINWRIVDMDYWYNTGSTALTTHHLVIMPDEYLYAVVMNDDMTTTGGYVGSKMYTNGLTSAKTTISEIFGDMVLTHKEYLSNAVTDGVVTGVVFKDSTVELPSEIMIYGTNIFSPINDGTRNFRGYTFSKTQLALFDVAPQFIINRTFYWLRDVISSDAFAGVDSSGVANWNGATRVNGVRPVFGIC